MGKNTTPFLGKRYTYNPAAVNRSLSHRALESLRHFEEKIRTEVYKRESCTCFCGNTDDYLLAERDFYGSYYSLVICKRCGLIRANPRMTQESYEDFYTHEYRTLYGDDDKPKEETFNLKVQEGKEVYDFITQHVSLAPQSVVFEVGCNMGYMLLPFRTDGHEVLGVDYGAENIAYGKEKTGLNLEVGGTEKLQGYGKKADFIFMSHVFEHFLDLDAAVQSLRDVLKPGGHMYIFVPGTFWFIENACNGNIMALLQNAHPWQFSLATLCYVMECHGFELVHGTEQTASIFKLTDTKKRLREDVPKGEFEKVLVYLQRLEKSYYPRYVMSGVLEKLGLKRFLKDLIRQLKKK